MIEHLNTALALFSYLLLVCCCALLAYNVFGAYPWLAVAVGLHRKEMLGSETLLVKSVCVKLKDRHCFGHYNPFLSFRVQFRQMAPLFHGRHDVAVCRHRAAQHQPIYRCAAPLSLCKALLELMPPAL